MLSVSRRDFIKSGAGLAAVVGVQGTTLAQETSTGAAADLAVINGRVYTVDEAIPRAEAFVVKNGRFIAVGSTADIRNIITTETQVIDAEGMTVTPGFIDAHCHASGVRELLGVDLDVRTIAEIKQKLAAKGANTKPDYWVSGFKYDDTKVVDEATGRYRRINRWDLDEAVTDRPVRVTHRGGHLSWYNSKALEMAGLTKDTPEPFGGRYEKDENGELTGLVEENHDAFSGIGKHSEETRADRQAGIKHISEKMTSSGLTSVHHAGGGTDMLIALQDAHGAGEMRYRMYFFPRGQNIFNALKTAGIYTGFGDEWLRIGPVKYGCDGSCSGRTMAMSTPYEGRPDDYGILTMTQEQVHEAVEEAHRHNFQVGIHANGDVAIDMVLNAYERVQKNWPRPDPRHRIEHCTYVNPDILQRMNTLGVIPAPFWTYAHYHGNKWDAYGQEKLKWFFAHRSFLDYDIPVAGASDYVPGPYEPLMAIQSMVTRKDFMGRVWGANQRVTVDEALKIGTVNGAHASFEENIKGSITAGKLADFAILEKDPHDVDPETIKEIKVVRTVVGGITMHEG